VTWRRPSGMRTSSIIATTQVTQSSTDLCGILLIILASYPTRPRDIARPGSWCDDRLPRAIDGWRHRASTLWQSFAQPQIINSASELHTEKAHKYSMAVFENLDFCAERRSHHPFKCNFRDGGERYFFRDHRRGA